MNIKEEFLIYLTVVCYAYCFLFHNALQEVFPYLIQASCHHEVSQT